MWLKNWLVIFNNLKSKLVTFHYHRANPEIFPVMMSGCDFNEALMRFQVLFCESHIYDQSVKFREKWPVHFIALETTEICVLSFQESLLTKMDDCFNS